MKINHWTAKNNEKIIFKVQKTIQWELGGGVSSGALSEKENDEKKQFFDSIWNTTASDYFSFELIIAHFF